MVEAAVAAAFVVVEAVLAFQLAIEQLAQPLCVRGVSLAARDVLDVRSVAEDQLELVLEHVPNRLPVHPRRLHRDMGDAKSLQPVAQREELACDGREAAPQLAALPLAVGNTDAGDDACLAHIERAATLVDLLHHKPPDRSTESPPKEPSHTRVCSTCARPNPGSRRAPRPNCPRASQQHQVLPASSSGAHHFHPSARARSGHGHCPWDVK